MKRALLVLVLASSCLDFQRRVDRCFDGGACAAGVEADGGGRLDGGFVPFDAGFFCTEAFCWESPFPHGVKLDSVFAEGDDLVVAGSYGMLAERIGGQWRSFQSQHSRELPWRNLWGRSMTDLWLAGDARAWHRTATGWSAVGMSFPLANSQSVAGSSTDTFFSAGADVFRLDSGEWAMFVSAPGEVMSLSMAFGALHGAIRTSAPSGSVTNLANGTTWAFDAGSTYSLFATSTALFVTGERTVQLDATLRPQKLNDVLRAGVEAEQQLFAANVEGVGVMGAQGFRLERRTPPVNAMAAGRVPVAVGDHGLILERRDGGWVDPTPTASRGDVVAFIEREALQAVTADCELLERGTSGWTSRTLLPTERCADAVADGPSLVVLTAGGSVVEFDASLGQTGRESLGSGLEGRRLWRAESGALVVTTATDVFVKPPGGLFDAVRALGGTGAWGVSGRGSLARVCGLAQGGLADLDLSRNPPVVTPVPLLRADDCRAVLPLAAGGWAIASREQEFPHVLVVAADGTSRNITLNLQATFIEDLLETPRGIAVASDGYAFINAASPAVRVEPSNARFSEITTLALWKGRLFVGGQGASILQAPAP